MMMERDSADKAAGKSRVLQGGLTRQTTQPDKVAPLSGGDEGTSAKAPQAAFGNRLTAAGDFCQ
jgi:hypothetical protein